MGTFRTVLATAAVIVVVGTIMEYDQGTATSGPAAQPVGGAVAPSPMMMATNSQGESVFGVPNVVTTPIDHEETVQSIAPVDAVYVEMRAPEMGTILASPVSGCPVTVTAQRQPAALVGLRVTAPCEGNTEFQIAHAGMRVTARTDEKGDADVALPALLPRSTFTIYFDNVLSAETEIFVPELRQYDRAVLQWRSTENMRLHALEGGADIGGPGHVWSASMHTAESTLAGENGFVVYLGDANAEIPYQAEVYTFPAGRMVRDGGVDLLIGVSVTENNCGREVDAETIQTNAGQSLVTAQIAPRMPGCEEIGTVAFLRDRFTDLTLAAN